MNFEWFNPKSEGSLLRRLFYSITYKQLKLRGKKTPLLAYNNIKQKNFISI